MRVIPFVAFAATCLLVPTVSAQTIARAAPRVAVAPQIAAAIRAIPRPALISGRVLRLREDRSGSFTPANLKGVSDEDLAKGRVIGVAKLSASNALGVPAGTYDYVVMKSDNTWHLYAVSGGRVFKQAREVRVSPATPAGAPQNSLPSATGGIQDHPLVLEPTSIPEDDSAACLTRFQHIKVTGVESLTRRVPVLPTVEYYTLVLGKGYPMGALPDIEPAATLQPDGRWAVKQPDGSWTTVYHDNIYASGVTVPLYTSSTGWANVSYDFCNGENVASWPTDDGKDYGHMLRISAPGFAPAYLYITDTHPIVTWGGGWW